MENGTITDTQKSESSRIYSLYYSFFLIPFMIAIFGGVFFLLFNSFPSGLNLYYTLFNVLTIVQQKLINKPEPDKADNKISR